ncbi:NACHT, LRR and PYD domains-containing protein 12-like [Dendronephthya gigantea]|uniref:NACHT, LRR and PYD domains-containing protein 12-like n=1 Tax=Dendronephthya gigantea TaxID=151771 RepID=UPI00106B7D3C|nr:NACHT, LRR and PYD domains-containing protein 12-like [Dendronephthya gigantea]
MDSCLKQIPRNCYNTFSSVVLALFVAIGVVLVGIASGYESKSSLECDLTRSLFKGKYIETQCRLQYAQEFLPSLSLNVQIGLSFGLVVVCSVVYGYLVRHRVDFFANPNTTTNGGVEENQPLSGASPAAPVAYQGSNRYFVFMAYIIHLIICRIIPLTILSAFLVTTSNFPTHFECLLPNMRATTSAFHENVTGSTTNSSFVDCTYAMGEKKQQVVVGFITINFLVDAVTLVEIVYLLWSAWKRPTFHTDQEFISVYLLQKRLKITLEINRELMKMIRESQCENLFDVHDDFGREELSRRKLEEIYINVIIQDGRERAYNPRRKFESRHQIYDVQLEKPPNSRILKSPAELFQAEKFDKKEPRTVLVVGRPGIGKTLLTRKIFHECQQNKERSGFWHGKFVLLIKFRDFNKGETSLREILSEAHGLDMSLTHCGMTVFQFVCKYPKNVILVFDGLDELKVDQKCLTDEIIINSPDKECHIFLILKQLVKGKLLPGATVLITSRPTAEYIYRHQKFDWEVEILGFNEEQIKKYVEKFCDDDMKSSEIWQIIKSSPELLSFCYIPVNSYIVCLTLYDSIDFGEQMVDGNYSNIPKTITELYKRAIKILLFKHNSKYRNKPVDKDYLTAELPELLQKDLDKLKGIARNGMEGNQLVFEFKSSDESVAGLSDSGVFNQLKDKRRNIFSFLHLTIQEFLAALHVVDDIKNVESFLEEHIYKPRWHLVIQFVAGLLGDRMRELRSAGHEDNEVIERICKRFQDWMPKKRHIAKSNVKGLLVIKCVWEMQEDRVMKMISSFASEDDVETFTLYELNIAPAESAALFKFLNHIKNLKQLRISRCTVTNIAIRELAEFLKKDNHGPESNNCELTELNVSDNDLKTEGAKYLSDALKSDNCKLTKLDVSVNGLKTEDIKYLSDALKNINCKLTKLDVRGNDLKTEGAKYLSDALKSDNCKLTELNVSVNDLQTEGVKYLSDALKSDYCKLTKLDVRV